MSYLDRFLVTSNDGITRAFDDRGALQHFGNRENMLRRYPDAQHIVMVDEESQATRVARANAEAVATKIAAHAALVAETAREEAEREQVDPYADDANPENLAAGDVVVYRPTFGGGSAVQATVLQDCPDNGGVILSAGGIQLGDVGYVNVRLLRRAVRS